MPRSWQLIHCMLVVIKHGGQILDILVLEIEPVAQHAPRLFIDMLGFAVTRPAVFAAVHVRFVSARVARLSEVAFGFRYGLNVDIISVLACSLNAKSLTEAGSTTTSRQEDLIFRDTTKSVGECGLSIKGDRGVMYSQKGTP